MPTLTISSEDLTYKKVISDLQAGKIMTFIAAENEAVDIGVVRATPDIAVGASVLSTPQLSVREWLDETEAKTNPQKILALAKYVLDQKNGDLFTPEEVRVLFQKAGEKVPKNFGRDLKEAVAAGYIQEALDSRGEYAITRTGESALAESFVSPRRASRPTASHTKRTSSAEAIRPEVLKVQLTAEPEGYINFHELPTKTAKIMWLLSYAYNTHSLESLHPQEINHLASVVRDQIPAKNVAGLMDSPIRKSYVTKMPDGRYKLLEKGEKELKQIMAGQEG